MLVSTALRLGDIMYLILILEICIITVIVKGRVLLEIPSMHKLVQYLQTLHRNEDIYELIENTSWKVLCTVFTHSLFLYQKSYSFAALTRSISDTSTTRA